MSDLDWAPPPCGKLVVLPAGEAWDAVRTDRRTARWALGVLDAVERGAAIVDARTDRVYWLLPPGAAARASYDVWERLRRHVSVLAAGPTTHYVGVPPVHPYSRPGPRWHVPAEWSGRFVTRPDHLAAVLGTAVVRTHGAVGLAPRRAAGERAELATTVGRSRPDGPPQRPGADAWRARAAPAPVARRGVDGATSAHGVSAWR
ncbi:hypothetical protein [Streptomyces sp. NPDC057702]|uniref:hypothetical protein n=1 Tax=unclassified Streptomyces TaxID=2593676 RepID=UPI0036C451A6